MVFFGTRSKKIKEGQLINTNCQYCETYTSMTYSVFASYFHLYWIPFVPYKRKTVVECNECYVTYEYKELPEQIKSKVDREKEKYGAKIPIWMYSGLMLLCILVSLAFYQSSKYDVKELDYKKNPLKGDVYFLNFTPSNYTTLRIDKVDKDSIYFTLNDTAVSKYTKVFAILNQRYYSTKKGTYSRKKLQELFKQDSIISITRK
ncbi:MAG: zinc-ribbon domain-containing protein [Bacteroidota bacterium]